MDFIKQIPEITFKLICHLFNNIILKDKFPSLLKTAQITLILKGGKNPTDPNSFRPIANLNVLNKIIEELMRCQLDPFFMKRYPEELHCELSRHSAKTAKCVIEETTSKQIEDYNRNTILSVDLSAAYDVVTHKFLI